MGINKKLFTGGDAGGLVADENFTPVLYTGNGSTQSITSLNFKPDLCWIKNTNTIADLDLIDSVRGATKVIESDLTDAQFTEATNLTSFDSNGFTVGSAGRVNNSGSPIIAWCWKAGGAPTADNSGGSSPTSGSIMVDGSAYTTTLTGTIIPKRASANTANGFSIIRYDGSGISNGTLNHFLSAAPELYIWKRLNTASAWSVAGSAVNNYQGYIELNTTGTVNTDSTQQAPTSSLIKFNTTSASYNGSGQEWILYCFHSVSGYQKIGSYNGHTTNATRIYTTDNGASGGANGFTPRWVMIKRTDGTGDWFIYDSLRGNTAGTGAPNILFANSNEAAYTINNTVLYMTFHSDGFQPATGDSGINGTGRSFLYWAIA